MHVRVALAPHQRTRRRSLLTGIGERDVLHVP